MKHFINKTLRRYGYEVLRRQSTDLALKKLLDNWSVNSILDIGANQGVTIDQWRALFPSAHITAFEPVATNYEILRKKYENVASVSLEKAAMSSSVGKSEIKLSGGACTHSFHDRAKRKSYGPPTGVLGTTELVAVTTLDTWMESEGRAAVDICKIDTEGHEKNVIKGAASTLKEQRINIVVLELMFVPIFKDQALYFELCDMMNDFCYRIYDIPSIRRHSDGQIRWGDAIFISDEFRKICQNIGEVS